MLVQSTFQQGKTDNVLRNELEFEMMNNSNSQNNLIKNISISSYA